MKKMQLVMVGNGMAGVRTLEELLKIAPDLYEITIFGAEPHPNYNRILLSPVLAGEQTLEQIVLNDWAWYAEHGITLHAGCTVTEVNRSYSASVPSSAVTLRWMRSICVIFFPACSVMPLSRYQAWSLSTMSGSVISPASTGESRMRL